MPMIKNLKPEDKVSIAKVIIAHGQAVDPKSDIYGWEDQNAYMHIKGHGWKNGAKFTAEPCHWVVPHNAEVLENTYYAFDGTFNDSSATAVLDVPQVTCACGQYTRTIRYDGSIANFIPLMFK